MKFTYDGNINETYTIFLKDENKNIRIFAEVFAPEGVVAAMVESMNKDNDLKETIACF